MVAQVIAGCIFSYLLGSIPFSYIIAKKVKGIDIRVTGEGNVGGRNVWHLVGKKYGILAGFLDISKGYGAYWIGYLLGLSPWWIWLCGFCVVLGHNFPVFLKGRGGKGIAAAMGFLLGIQPLVKLILSLRFKTGIISGQLHPLTVLFAVLILLNSFRLSLFKKKFEWEERLYPVE